MRTLILILALAGCTNLREAVNCDNAAKVRAAATRTIEISQKAITEIDRACPIPAINEGN